MQNNDIDADYRGVERDQQQSQQSTVPYARFTPLTWFFFIVGFILLIATLSIAGKTYNIVQSQSNFDWIDDETNSENLDCLIRRGCRAYITGYSLVGSTNYAIYEVVDIPSINSPCDCHDLCEENSDRCVTWTWAYTDSSSRRRSCILSSNLVSPTGVVTNFADSPLANPINQNPQIGMLAPKCLGASLSPSSVDEKCVSGIVIELDGGQLYC